MYTLNIDLMTGTGRSEFGLFTTKSEAIEWLKENGWKKSPYSTNKAPVFQRKKKTGAYALASVQQHLELHEMPDVF